MDNDEKLAKDMAKAAVGGKMTANDEIREKTTKQFLRYHFTEEDLRGLAADMVQAKTEIEEAEGRLTTTKKQIQAEIQEASAALDLATSKYRAGYEMRNIECREVHDFTDKTVRIYRNDSGELVRERPMTEEEQQRPLPLEGEAEEGRADLH